MLAWVATFLTMVGIVLMNTAALTGVTDLIWLGHRRELVIAGGVMMFAGIALYALGLWLRRTTRRDIASEPIGSEKISAWLAYNLGVNLQNQGQYDEAEALFGRSLEIAERLGDMAATCATYHQLAVLTQLRDQYDEAERLYQRSLQIKERLGDKAGIARSLHQLGVLAQVQGRYEEAEELYRRSLEIAERLGNQAGVARTLHQLGVLAQDQGRYEEAERLFRQALEIFQRLGSPEAETTRRSLERASGQIPISPNLPMLEKNLFQQEPMLARWWL